MKVVRTSAACLLLAAVLLFASSAFAASTPDLSADVPPAGGIWLESLDLSMMTTGFGRPAAAATVAGSPISIGNKAFIHGVGTHADAEITLKLSGRALRFLADVGVDDDLKCARSMKAPAVPAVEFSVWLDGKKVATSGVARFGDAPIRLDVNLQGAKTMRLLVQKKPGARFSHATWGGAALMMKPGAALPVALPPKGKRRDLAAMSIKIPALSAREEAQVRAPTGDASILWLDTLDLSKSRMNAGNLWLGGIVSRAPRGAEAMTGRKAPDGSPLRLGGVSYPRGIASSGENEVRINVDGAARRLVARVGFNTSLSCGKVESSGDALFEVWVDGRPVVQTSHMHGYDRPYDVSVDLRGAKLLVLNATSDGGPVAWAGAFLELEPGTSIRPQAEAAPAPEPAVVAKRNAEEVRINGARVIGTTPQREFLFLIPATGKPPLRFEAKGLPAGLTLNPTTGIISGAVKKAGTTVATVTVTAANGTASRSLKIIAGRDKLAMTPPMGWNSWNVWGMEVDDAKVRAAADAFVKTGLSAVGFAYLNIDDGWSDGRDSEGNIKTNRKFSDMAALASYVHSKGLRLGIYSSPGPKTCGHLEGSYKHELQDARTWAAWGVDYLKHDWCSYGSIAKDTSLKELQKPYKVMHAALDRAGRDVVFGLCQYGLGDVWNWGRRVGGNVWRTGADITDTWASLSDLGFTQSGRESGAGPGGWNDPDMMVLGKVGWSSKIRNTQLAPNEQVTHVTLWAMLAAPLLLGNDLSQVDEFTLDLLTNPEVIDVDQDPLGRQGTRRVKDGAIEVWSRPLFDGTTAVALFNRGQVPADGKLTWKALGLRGAQPVRNLWLRREEGVLPDSFATRVPSHGSVLLRVGKPQRN